MNRVRVGVTVRVRVMVRVKVRVSVRVRVRRPLVAYLPCRSNARVDEMQPLEPQVRILIGLTPSLGLGRGVGCGSGLTRV